MILTFIAIVISLLFSAFFSGIETGLISLDKLKLENEAENSILSKQILKVLNKPDRLLGITLLGTNIFLVIISTLTTIQFVDEATWRTEGTITLITSAFVLIFAEILPKAIFRDYPEKMVFLMFPLFKAFDFILKPLVSLITVYYKAFSKLFKVSHDYDPLTREDISYFLSRTKNENTLEKFQIEMLEEALDFADLKAKNIMIPRTEIVAVSKDATYQEIISLSTETGFTRFPVYDDDIDKILGIVIIYDFLALKNESEFNLLDFVREPVYCHETMNVDAVLKDLQLKRKSLAIVLDSYGGTAGLITVEDILEEIVGEIEDEYDSDVEAVDLDIEKIDDSTYIVKGFVDVDLLNTEYNFDLPEGNYETIAGLIIDKLARIPQKGQKLSVGKWNIEVIETTVKKIKKVKFTIKKNDY